jgi:hypothetical protein
MRSFGSAGVKHLPTSVILVTGKITHVGHHQWPDQRHTLQGAWRGPQQFKAGSTISHHFKARGPRYPITSTTISHHFNPRGPRYPITSIPRSTKSHLMVAITSNPEAHNIPSLQSRGPRNPTDSWSPEAPTPRVHNIPSLQPPRSTISHHFKRRGPQYPITSTARVQVPCILRLDPLRLSSARLSGSALDVTMLMEDLPACAAFRPALASSVSRERGPVHRAACNPRGVGVKGGKESLISTRSNIQ